MESQSESQYDYAQATDVGCVRELNEDSIHSEPGLWLVADGMGGHACGEIASAMAIEEITSHCASKASLSQAIQEAHHKITDAGQADSARSGMGTTIVAMTSDTSHFQVAWVGDSRAYLWDQKTNKLTQISEDHSLMVRLINAGLIDEQDALTHPQRHMITQCLGSTEIEQVKVDTVEMDWTHGQQVLLCSDGLTDEVNDSMISEILSASMSLQEKISSLIKTAKTAGGRDNISVVIVQSPVSKPLTIFDKFRKLFHSFKH